MSETPEKALQKLLLDLFDAEEFRRLVQELGGGGSIVAELPSEAMSNAHLFSMAVKLLRERGEIDDAFFAALSRARPRRQAEIDRVAGLWAPRHARPQAQSDERPVVVPASARPLTLPASAIPPGAVPRASPLASPPTATHTTQSSGHTTQSSGGGKRPDKPICFVAQPFRDPFQGRFDEDIEPAIEEAGLVAYKVDNDVAADKLIDDIHAGIERAAIVLVDITLDNPNVWYELGYSQALKKPLVMISCSSERPPGTPYPFDVRGRKVIEYATGKRSNHQKLQKDVSARLKALLEKLEHAPPLRAPPVVRSTMAPGPNSNDAVNLIRMAAKKLLPKAGEETIVFAEWDQTLGLQPGTTARLIKTVFSYPYYVKSVGNTTACLAWDIEF